MNASDFWARMDTTAQLGYAETVLSSYVHVKEI
jgi:hypothetical protein